MEVYALVSVEQLESVSGCLDSHIPYRDTIPSPFLEEDDCRLRTEGSCEATKGITRTASYGMVG